MQSRFVRVLFTIKWQLITDVVHRQFVHSDRHVNNILMLPYCDELARDLGVFPSLLRLLGRVIQSPISGWAVLFACFLCAPVASQYRLFGHGSCLPLAEQSIKRAARSGSTLSTGELLELSRHGQCYGHQRTESRNGYTGTSKHKVK